MFMAWATLRLRAGAASPTSKSDLPLLHIESNLDRYL